MSVVIALLRGVNVGGRHPVRMDLLRKVSSELGCTDVQTYVQSGNLVLRSPGKGLPVLKQQLETAFKATFGFEVPVVLRSAGDVRKIVKHNPFPKRVEAESAKLHVTFLYDDPGEANRKLVRAMTFSPEDVRIEGREIYTYYPEGAGKSKLRWPMIEKVLGTPGTARNWNSVLKLLAMAEAMEQG